MTTTATAPPDTPTKGKPDAKTPDTGAPTTARRRVPREVWLLAAPVAVGLVTLASMTLGPTGAVIAVVALVVLAALVWWLRRRHAARNGDTNGKATDTGKLPPKLARALARIPKKLMPKGLAARLAPRGRGLPGLSVFSSRTPRGARGGMPRTVLGRSRAARAAKAAGLSKAPSTVLGRSRAQRSGAGTQTGSTRRGLFGRKPDSKAGASLLGRSTKGSAPGGRPSPSGPAGSASRPGSRPGSGGGRSGSRFGKLFGAGSSGGGRSGGRGSSSSGGSGRRFSWFPRRDKSKGDKHDPWTTPEAAKYIAEFLPGGKPKPPPEPDPDDTQPVPRKYIDPPTLPEITPVSPRKPLPDTPRGGEMTADYKAAVTDVTSATEARQIMKTKLPEHLSQESEYLRKKLGGILDGVNLSPEYADAVHTWLNQRELNNIAITDVTDTFDRTHADRIERLESGLPQEKAWDFSANEG
ncbi:hypothetical protein [Actinophytocola sp.]|uniref:hypothetical protein n=1 Tax=Actinophytocola sp. TaxID=1872138 RepID=UPI002D6741BC|nr:hypothetical protein [Actinophytocola sp.]HYQ69079.1 hypothetical protein [Actinophytocola sp.]